MRDTHILHGWHLSYFSGKVRAYLRYKRIPFRDNAVNAFTLMRRIPRKTGEVVMPVVVTPAGEWLQDTTAIIETLERRFPERPVVPETPRQRIAALLLEAWADEWWIPAAMHYRWSYPENYALFERDAGSAMLPRAPGFLQRRVAAHAAGRLRAYLPAVGVVPAQYAAMERWTETMLDALDDHFARVPYLLGGWPTLADFALVGPLYGHLGRDPWPRRELIAARAHLAAWIERVHGGDGGDAPLLPDDAVADSLRPVLQAVFREFLPMVDGIRDATAAAVERLAPGRKRLPRSLGPIRFPMGGSSFSRDAMPYTLWMMQRVQSCYQALGPAGRQSVDSWLASYDAAEALSMDLGPALQRAGLRAALA